ncbi:MAG: pyrimidine 5'-nucleotidase [Alphaproteobacteria bacterium]
MTTPPDSAAGPASAPATAPAFPPDLRHVTTWVFDLDNTLYPADGQIFAQVDQRMSAFIADYLDVDPMEARRVQKLYYHEFGTTLSGLMTVHGMAPKPFLDYVHDIDVSMVEPDTALDEALARLPGRKVIYTNGSVAHAENVLGRLGIRRHFTDIFDIVAADYVPKPHRAAYEHIFSHGRIDPRSAIMFEDIARNLEAAYALGLVTVWVRPRQALPGDGDTASAEELARHPHIHHVTDDLAAFLASARID